MKHIVDKLPHAEGYTFYVDRGCTAIELAQYLNQRHYYFNFSMKTPSWLFKNVNFFFKFLN